MTEAERNLLKWFRAEYRRRTAAVRNSEAKIEWLDPGTRVSWSEVTDKARELGITRDVVSLRQWWSEQR